MRKLFLVCGLILAGCGYQKVAVPVEGAKPLEVQKRKLTDAQKIALLRAEAHKRGLKWRIFCVDWSDDDRFNASAWWLGQDNPEHDRWIVEESTQADAAYSLYQAIQGSPTHPARPPELEDTAKKARERHKIAMCPPELRGD